MKYSNTNIPMISSTNGSSTKWDDYLTIVSQKDLTSFEIRPAHGTLAARSFVNEQFCFLTTVFDPKSLKKVY